MMRTSLLDWIRRQLLTRSPLDPTLQIAALIAQFPGLGLHRERIQTAIMLNRPDGGSAGRTRTMLLRLSLHRRVA